MSLADAFALHERLVRDAAPAIVDGPCRCGHEADEHVVSAGYDTRCRADGCECKRLHLTQSITDAGRAWQDDAARLDAMVQRMGFRAHQWEIALSEKYCHAPDMSFIVVALLSSQ